MPIISIKDNENNRWKRNKKTNKQTNKQKQLELALSIILKKR